MKRAAANAADCVRDHIPLEQGLRRTEEVLYDLRPLVRDHIPLEQGLRHSRTYPHTWSYTVRDHIPLEQGLRRTIASVDGAQRLRSETIFH